MAKSKESKLEEYYKGEIRKLKKENKQLRQQLKYENNIDEVRKELSELEESQPDNEPVQHLPCHDCGKGFYAEYELMGRVYGTCSICSHRKRLK